MYEPEVTIITPTNNIIDAGKADDFTLLVNLLNRQSYPYIEHLIVDNASKDETTTFLKEYKNAGYINFISAPDTGKYDAINKGLMKAKGKYIGIVSCDDFYHDITAISDLVQAMEEDNADYCCFSAYCVQPNDTVLFYEPSILNVFQVMPCSHQATFYKKEALEKLGYFDAKFKIMADYDMILRLVLNKFNGILLDKNLVTYKMAEQSLKHGVQVEAESKHIFHKNFRNLHQMTDEIVDRMVNLSEIPKPLLDKLAQFFPESQEEFYDRYQRMCEYRAEVARQARQAQRLANSGAVEQEE